jgi:hypothetical protein
MSADDSTNSTKWQLSSEGRERPRGTTALQWKREAQLLDRRSATADYDAVQLAQRENMTRLRALRLARDAANALCAPAGALPVKTRKPRKKTASVRT